MASGAASGALQHLLTENRQFALNGRGTTNHCPMALVALERLGASPTRLTAFFEAWTRRYALPETGPELDLTDNNWHTTVANPQAFRSLSRYFAHRISVKGHAEVIATVVSNVAAAPATAAFHALIRLGYAIEAAHEGEIAAGLASYVATHLPITIGLNDRQPAKSVNGALAMLSGLVIDGCRQHESITRRLGLVVADRSFRDIVPSPPQTDLFEDLAITALQLYWQTADFTALHLVTGLHALRLINTYLPPAIRHKMSEAVWLAFCAAFVLIRQPMAAVTRLPNTLLDWTTIAEMAVRSDDDHVIKMSYSCWQEHDYRSNDLYRAAASRLVMLGHA